MIFQLMVAVATAGVTWILGWWGVAVVAVAAGVIARREGGHTWLVALGTMEGWAILMLIDAATGPLRHVASLVSGAMSLPAAALVAVTLLFPALIGWSGATLGALVGHIGRVEAKGDFAARRVDPRDSFDSR